LSKLSKSCAWGCKKNSQGNVSTWKGYKLHLDVSDIGFSITAIVTGASVHDSQAAIPIETLTGRKVQHLYSLMDAANEYEGTENLHEDASQFEDPEALREDQFGFSPRLWKLNHGSQ
jgi:hypothetical protein